MNDLKATEDSLSNYAKMLENDLAKMHNDETELKRTTEQKLEQVEQELQELKQKEVMLKQIDDAIDLAISSNADNTVFDDENLYNDDESAMLEDSDINVNVMNDEEYNNTNIQTTEKFHKLIEDKEQAIKVAIIYFNYVFASQQMFSMLDCRI